MIPFRPFPFSYLPITFNVPLIIFQKLEERKFPSHWAAEGVVPPNDLAVGNAYKISIFIYDKYGVLPLNYAATKENGVFFIYHIKEYSLIVETYNDGEIALLVNDEVKKEVVYNEDILDYNLSKLFSFLKEKEIC